jgi:hypothetical protein
MNGLVYCLMGLDEGSKSDWGMWKDGLQEVVVKKAWNKKKRKSVLFGGKRFWVEDGIIGAYRRNARIPPALCR